MSTNTKLAEALRRCEACTTNDAVGRQARDALASYDAEQAWESDPTSDAFKAGMAAMEYAIWDGKEPCPCRKQAAKAVPADLRSAAERTRQDLGPTGSNYPDVRVLLAFVEQALAAPEAQQTAARASVDDWERELSAVMPADFKDWWQNSRREWPAVAAEVIKSLRRDRDAGWEVAARAQRREPLTDEQIAEGRYRTWAAEPEDAPEAWSFLRGARWAEKHFGIGATTGKEPGNA